MKEPKVHVGILFEPQIEFILLNPYHINGMEISGTDAFMTSFYLNL